MNYKTCTKCDASLPATLEFFYKQVRGLFGVAAECKQCNWERTKAKRKKNPSVYSKIKHREHRKHAADYARRRNEWRKANPERARMHHTLRNSRKRSAEGFFTSQDIEFLRVYQEDRCTYCQQFMGDDYTIDHLIPLSRGGSNWPENILLACASCNSSKQDKTEVEYRQLMAH